MAVANIRQCDRTIQGFDVDMSVAEIPDVNIGCIAFQHYVSRQLLGMQRASSGAQRYVGIGGYKNLIVDASAGGVSSRQKMGNQRNALPTMG